MLGILLACHTSLVIDSPKLGDSDPSDDPLESIPGNGDSSDSAPPESDPQDSDPDDPGDGGAALWDDSYVHEVILKLSDESIRSLNRDPDKYVEASVVLDGNEVSTVAVHIKGSSSLRTLNQKAAFKVDFNYFLPEQDYEGLSKITLNNMVNDDTQLHEAMAWKFYRSIGMPWNRVSYTWLKVEMNGQVEDFGLYLILETWGGDWQERIFGDKDGNIYEGGYPYYPDAWDHADFNRQEAPNFELEDGTDVQNADIIAASEVLGGRSDDWSTAVAPYLDINEYARYEAAEVWVGHWDGYVFAVNNFRTRVDVNGKVTVIPSGLDWTFQDWASWDRPTSSLGSACKRDTACKDALAVEADFVCNTVETAGLVEEFDRLQELIQPYVQIDSRREYNLNQLPRTQDAMRTWLENRCEFIRQQYPL